MDKPAAGSKIIVGMSGGVDSSVTAAILVEQGYQVIGIAMRLWGEASTSGCCSLDDFLDARKVAGLLGIPFYVMDFRSEFSKAVVDPFVGEYLRGRTPNPCVRCNQFVKFDHLLLRARELGAEWVATGHYARSVWNEKTGRRELWAAVDPEKDQSYFLFAVGQATLERTLFPIGGMTKPEVRAYAEKLDLNVAHKPESQEICFAPKGEYGSFVEKRAPARPKSGVIVDDEGRELGKHSGVHRYTIGQRKGLGISSETPLYVSAIEAEQGVIRVGRKESVSSSGLVARNVYWHDQSPPPVGSHFKLKIRSRFAPSDVILRQAESSRFSAEAATALKAVSPGQAAVLYDGARIIGGGWIEKALPPLYSPLSETVDK